MNVAFFAPDTGLYGANRALVRLIEGLQHLGVACFVVTPDDGELNEKLRAMGVPECVVAFERWMTRERSWPKVVWRLRHNLTQRRRLVEQLRAWHVDVVYSNST